MKVCPIRVLRSVLSSYYEAIGVERVTLITEDLRFDFTIEESLDENGLLFWFVHAGERVYREIGLPVPYPFELVRDPSGVTAIGWYVAAREVEDVAVTLGIWCVFEGLVSGFESGQYQVVQGVLLIQSDTKEAVLV